MPLLRIGDLSVPAPLLRIGGWVVAAAAAAAVGELEYTVHVGFTSVSAAPRLDGAHESLGIALQLIGLLEVNLRARDAVTAAALRGRDAATATQSPRLLCGGRTRSPRLLWGGDAVTTLRVCETAIAHMVPVARSRRPLRAHCRVGSVRSGQVRFMLQVTRSFKFTFGFGVVRLGFDQRSLSLVQVRLG